MKNNIIRIATRKSLLALWQANYIATLLKTNWPELKTELVPMQTSGDQYLKDKLLHIGGKGLFVKELELAMINNVADIAVHSMKDMPSSLPNGLNLKIVANRANPYDALVSQKFSSLTEFPDGAIIGTSSLRRQAQILAYHPRITVKNLRGNIHTRIKKLEDKEYDGIILAASGLQRMELNAKISEIIPENIMLPACGQGALGIEYRENDHDILKFIKPLSDELTSLCVNTERYINMQLGGSCHAPIGIFCKPIDESNLILKVKVLSPDGKDSIYDEQTDLIKNRAAMADRSISILKQKGVEKLLSIK